MKYIQYEINDAAAWIKVNRPKELNALNTEVIKELYDVCEVLEKEAVRAAVFTGSGEKAFIAGADITEMVHLDSDQALQFTQNGHRTMDRIANLPMPTIAMIQGYALGGGTELALACDIRIASEKAKMGIPETSLGVIPGFGGTQRLARLVGPAKALEMLYTAKMITAAEAEKIGLVNQVTAPEELKTECEKLVAAITKNSKTAIAAGKKCVWQGLEGTLEEGLKIEQKAFSEAFSTADQKEGMNAFVEKRKPEFQ